MQGGEEVHLAGNCLHPPIAKTNGLARISFHYYYFFFLLCYVFDYNLVYCYFILFYHNF